VQLLFEHQPAPSCDRLFGSAPKAVLWLSFTPTMGLGGHAEVKSVGPLDRFMDYVAGFEDWLRTRVTPKLIPFLPSFVTPNVITSVDFLVVVGFTVAAAWTQFLDSFWLKTFLRVLVVVLFIVFAVLDVLVRVSLDVNHGASQQAHCIVLCCVVLCV